MANRQAIQEALGYGLRRSLVPERSNRDHVELPRSRVQGVVAVRLEGPVESEDVDVGAQRSLLRKLVRLV